MQFSFSDLLRIGIEQYEMFIEENYTQKKQERNIVLLRQLSDYMLVSPSAISNSIIEYKNNYIAGFTKESIATKILGYAKSKSHQYMIYNFANKEALVSISNKKSRISQLFNEINQSDNIRDPFSKEFRPYIHRLYYDTDPIVYVTIEDVNLNNDILKDVIDMLGCNPNLIYLRIARLFMNSIFNTDVNFYSTDAKILFGKVSPELFFELTNIRMYEYQDVIVETIDNYLQITFFINCSLKKKYFEFDTLSPELQQIYNYLYY